MSLSVINGESLTSSKGLSEELSEEIKKEEKSILQHIHTNRKIITYVVFMVLCIMYIFYLEIHSKKNVEVAPEVSSINIRDKLTKDEQLAWKSFVIESVDEHKKEKSKRDKLFKKLKTSAGFTLISTALRWNDAISISEIVISTFIANVIIFLSDY